MRAAKSARSTDKREQESASSSRSGNRLLVTGFRFVFRDVELLEKLASSTRKEGSQNNALAGSR
jgi:hypothetical protein